MAFDPVDGYVLLFGGRRCEAGLGGTGPCTGLHDTWSWNGSNWSERRPAHVPDASLGTMVYDAGARKVVFMTGSGSGWQWDGKDWSAAWSGLVPPAPPAPTGPVLQDVGFSIGYDEDRQMMVVLSQRLVTDVRESVVVQTQYFVTSAWDGSEWRQLAMTSGDTLRDAAGPDLQFGLMAFDRDRHQVFAMGIKSTWIWDGSRWTPHPPSVMKTEGQELYDPVGHRMLWLDSELDGKHYYGTRHIYSWSGDAWTEVGSSNRPYDDSPSAAFDEARGVVVLFGGESDG
jgi:hypothetical protein